MKRAQHLYPVTGCILALMFPANLQADEDRIYQIQKKRLERPSKIVLKAEKLRQSVFIYESMKEEDIDQALEQQFDRVENMMFVKTRVTNASGEEEVEDDGCD